LAQATTAALLALGAGLLTPPAPGKTQGFWQVKLDYLHANPCRDGLVTRPQDWRFSLASFWYPLSGGQVPVNDVVLTPIYW